MEKYKLYWVGQAKVQSGKLGEATNWWREKGAPNLLADPWTKSLKCFASQFGLGGEYTIEVWQAFWFTSLTALNNQHEQRLVSTSQKRLSMKGIG